MSEPRRPTWLGATVGVILTPLEQGLADLVFAPGELIRAMLVNPTAFPLGLYVALVPFDPILSVGSAGTVTRFLGVLAILALFAGRLIVANGHFVKPHRVVWGWVALVALAGVSAFWTVSPRATIDGMFTLAGLLLIYLGVSIFPFSERDYRCLSSLIIAGGVLASAYALVSYLLGKTFFDTTRATLVAGTSRYSDPNYFAVSLVLPLLLLLGRAVVKGRGGIGRHLIGLVLVGATILLTGSGGALAGAGVGGLVLFWRAARRRRPRWKVVILLMVVGGICVSGILADREAGRELASRLNPSDLVSTGGHGRFAIWQVGWAAFVARPVLGYGYATFPSAYEQFREDFPQSMVYFTRPYRVAHSLYVQVMVTLGIVGLLLLLCTLLGHWRVIRRLSKRSSLAIPVEAAYVGMLVSSVTLSTVAYKAFWLPVLLILLLRNVFREEYDRRDSGDSAKQGDGRSARGNDSRDEDLSSGPSTGGRDKGT